MKKLSEIISVLENFAPRAYQETYDNSGLIVGSPEMEISGALICLDSTEAVVDEALRLKMNLIIAHHPIIFSGLKKINGKNYVERTIIKAIQNNIAIYAIHTNLDNVRKGVNQEICKRLGIIETRILAPKSGVLRKLVTYSPESHAIKVRDALFAAGAGSIGNYDECSFSVLGTGSFRGNKESTPFVGEKGERHHEKEERIEVIFEKHLQGRVLSGLRAAHPYEEIAYDIFSLENQHHNIGSGMIGELEKPLPVQEFLSLLKKVMKAEGIRYTIPNQTLISKVAVCGGSGSFLLQDAIHAGADAFVTADFKYHQYFDADEKILIADIGHYESEQFTKDLIYNILNQKFPTFALRLSEVKTNPINYF